MALKGTEKEQKILQLKAGYRQGRSPQVVVFLECFFLSFLWMRLRPWQGEIVIIIIKKILKIHKKLKAFIFCLSRDLLLKWRTNTMLLNHVFVSYKLEKQGRYKLEVNQISWRSKENNNKPIRSCRETI